jgi:hypothetical protein
MAASFTFTVKPEKQASYARIELIVVVLHLFTFIILAVLNYPAGIGMLVLGIGVAAVYLLLYYYRKSNRFRLTLMEVPLYFFGLWWLNSGVYWMAVLVLVFSIFATLSRQKIQVIVTEDAVLYRSFPQRSIQWAELDNVILKDGLLTIDFKNNKIIQQLIEDNNISEAAFNSFCNQNIRANTVQQ